MILREMRLEDAETVALLTAQLGYDRDADAIGRWISTLQHPTEQAAFVACVVDKVVGWIEVSIERRLQSAPFAMIGGLVVSEDVRGRGIGRELCARVERWAWDQGVETVRVTSRSTRGDAHRFYLRDGYRQLKTSLVFEKCKTVKKTRP